MVSNYLKIFIFLSILFVSVNSVDCGVQMTIPMLQAVEQACNIHFSKHNGMETQDLSLIRTVTQHQLHNLDKIPKNCDFLQQAYELVNKHLECINKFSLFRE